MGMDIVKDFNGEEFVWLFQRDQVPEEILIEIKSEVYTAGRETGPDSE